jgi:acylphosphatase
MEVRGLQADNRERAHVNVTGQVQGVFFRDSTREKAEDLGLSGWVKNTPDGGVEAVFEGPSDRVREMVRWCEQGPPNASVADVDAEFGPAHDDLAGFEVR